MTDLELLTRYRDGDVAAFESILERYEKPLVRYVARYRPRAAQDLVQEVFLRLVRQAPELNGLRSLSAWLYRVARNLTVDDARREERMDAKHQAVAAPEVQPPAPAPAETDEVAGIVAEKIFGLPSRQRDILILKIQEEKSYREISEITGLTISNVGYVIHQGLKALAGELRRAGIV